MGFYAAKWQGQHLRVAAMNEIKTVDVGLHERSYRIHIGCGLLLTVLDYLPFDLKGRSVFVLTDENVTRLHAGPVYEALKGGKPQSIQLLALPPGEQTKSMEAYEQVVAWMLDHNVSRESVVFAVGGGVIGDLAGFAAATVMRGITYVQIPTTLLAQVDSSVGGKTAIDMPQGKNLVGAFYQPACVLADLETLKTLPKRELLAGYAEIVKYGLINDPEFFIWLEKEGENLLGGDIGAQARAVEISCNKKADIVEADEKEAGERALLNFGHTFGHALEAATHYDGRLLHGEAVAIGMVMAFRLSVRMGLCKESEADRVEAHLAEAGLPTGARMIFPPLETDAADIVRLMQRDKKVEKGKIKFILTRGIGKTFISRDVDMDDVTHIVRESLEGA